MAASSSTFLLFLLILLSSVAVGIGRGGGGGGGGEAVGGQSSGPGMDVALSVIVALSEALSAGDVQASTRLLEVAMRLDRQRVCRMLGFATRAAAPTTTTPTPTTPHPGVSAGFIQMARSLDINKGKKQQGVGGRGLSGIELMVAKIFEDGGVGEAAAWTRASGYCTGELASLEKQLESAGVGKAEHGVPADMFRQSVPLLLGDDELAGAHAACKLLVALDVGRAMDSKRRAGAARNWLVSSARALLLFHRYEHASRALRAALLSKAESGGEDAEAACLLAHASHASLEWSDYDDRLATLSRIISTMMKTNGGPPASQCITPFIALTSPLDVRLITHVASSAARKEEMVLAAGGEKPLIHHSSGSFAPPPLQGGKRLKVVYVTSEWGDNSVGREMAAVLASHSRNGRVVASCVTVSPRPKIGTGGGRWWGEVGGLCDGGIRDVSSVSDGDAAREINKGGYHLLVDLNGWMPGARAGILAMRPVLIQIGYKNFVASGGAGFEPYIVTDRVASPPEFAKDDYTEKLILLPGSFYATEDYAQTHPEVYGHSPKVLSGDVVDVANAAVGGKGARELVANFNNWKKLDPGTLDVWCDVLLNRSQASLWLMNMLPYQGPEQSLRDYVESRGVDPKRVVVSDMLPASTHLTTKRSQATLFIDSLEYNAHSTAVELLWAGVLVVTSPSRKMTARVGASLLVAAGVVELIAWGHADLASLTLALLQKRHTRERLVSRLEKGRSEGLFDVKAWTKGYESALSGVWEAALSAPKGAFEGGAWAHIVVG